MTIIDITTLVTVVAASLITVALTTALTAAWSAIRRRHPFKWWLALGYWFNAQYWGPKPALLVAGSACWNPAFPAPVCKRLATFFLKPTEMLEAHTSGRARTNVNQSSEE